MLYLKAWQKVLLIVFILLSVILFSIPRVAQKYIVKNSYDLVGRRIEMDKTRINYFTGVLRIKGFTFYEKDSTHPFVSFSKLLVNIDYLPFFQNELRVSEIKLDGLFVQLVQDSLEFNFSDLIPAEDTLSPAEEQIDTVQKGKRKIAINNIELFHGVIRYHDIPLDHIITLDTLDLIIPGFSWDKSSTKLDFDFGFKAGGGVYTRLEHEEADSSFSIHVQLDSLNLDIIEPYINQFIQVSDVGGYYSNNLFIQGSLKHLTHFSSSGEHRIDDFSIIDTLGRKVFSFDELSLDVDTFIFAEKKWEIRHFHLWQPLVYFELIDSTNNWLAMMRKTDSKNTDSLSINDTINEEEQALSVVLHELAVLGGQILFQDKTLRYPLSYVLNDIQLESNEISKDANITVKLSAGLNGTGEMNTMLVLKDETMSNMNLDLAIKQFRMKDLEPYFKHYMGYPVEEGFMNFSTSNILGPNSLSSNNNLYVHNLELGDPDKKEAEINIPLRLAIGILSDKNDAIDIAIPVEVKNDVVNIDNLGKLIFKAIGNVFLKAATSPYTLLANLYGVNPEKIKAVELDKFQILPTKDGIETLDLLSQVLTEKHQLRADLYHAWDSSAMTDSLAYVLAKAAYNQQSIGTSLSEDQVNDSLFIVFLERETGVNPERDHHSISALCCAMIGPELLTLKLDSIRAEQVDFVREYLTEDKGIEAERFQLFNQASDTVEVEPGDAFFSVYYKSMGSSGEE